MAFAVQPMVGRWSDRTRWGRRALYLGLANSASVVGSIGGRLGGPLIDGVNQLSGTVFWGYGVVYTLAALFFGLSSLVVLKIPHP